MKIRILNFTGQRMVIALALLLPFRTEAVDLVVYNTNNAGAGSLRQAINDNGALGGGNTIIFSNTVTGTITLASELVITTNVTIAGPGADVLTLSGNNASRIVHVNNGIIHASGLTIANGSASPGGGILQNSGTLNLKRCVISNNVSGSFGGGIAASGVVALAECLIVRNRGFSADGVGMAQINGSLTATNCTFVLNTNTFGRGGALDVLATATIVNCTFVSNSAPGGFGGALINYGTVGITNCTFTRNDAGSGGGIHNTGSGSTTVRNSIIAGNTAPDAAGTFISGGYNLIGTSEGSTGWIGLADQVGSTNAPLDPLLGPLQNNGGSTPTVAPLPGSLAIDQGNSSGISTDQRGRSRPYTNDPSALIPIGGDHSDIGAYEIHPMTLIVSNANDSGAGSLRQTVLSAGSTDKDTILFAPNVTNTITLISGEIVLNKSLSIVGPGANVLTVSGNNASRVFHLSGRRVSLAGLTIANGRAENAYGGGILADGDIHTIHTIAYCQIVSNAVTGFGAGGGICVRASFYLSLSNCSVIHNVAGINGGGIALVEPAILDIYSSTIASNRTTHIYDGFPPFPHGGGISVLTGSVLVASSTIASNVSTYVAGGIGNGLFSVGTVQVVNSIIAGNTATASGPDVLGPFYSVGLGYNLIGNPSGSTGFTNFGDQVNVNPLLGPLANYGGPTPTMALRAGSPAIDKGYSPFSLKVDQRGFPLPLDDPGITNAPGGDGSDIGAFEVDPRFRIVDLRRVGSDVALSMMTVLGRNYRAEYTNDLASGDWTTFTNNIPGSGYLLWVTNSGGANQPRRFYRGAVVP